MNSYIRVFRLNSFDLPLVTGREKGEKHDNFNDRIYTGVGYIRWQYKRSRLHNTFRTAKA